MDQMDIQQLQDQADTCYKEGRLEAALQAYQSILEHDSNHAWAHSRIGAIMAQWDRVDEAEAALRKAIELDPKLAQAHSNLGNIFYVRGEYEAALQKYQDAVALNPENPIFHQNLHAALKKLGRLSEAVAALKQAHRLDRQQAKEEARAKFRQSSRQIQRRLGCLPAALIMTLLFITIVVTALI
jgi:Flp pilus assembly protein TadD